MTVEAPNWFAALGTSMEGLGLDGDSVSRLVVNLGEGGMVDVSDPVSGRSYRLMPVQEPARIDLSGLAAPPALTMPASTLAPEPEPPAIVPPAAPPLPEESISDESTDVAGVDPEADTIEQSHPGLSSPTLFESSLSIDRPSRPPEFSVPLAPKGQVEENDRPDDLAEQIFDLSFDITLAADVKQACDIALEVLHGLVPAESGAALHTDINSTGLRFISAFGPKSSGILGRTISFETGVAGFCHQHGVGLLVSDAVRDERHDKSVDRQVGYTTRDLIAVPLKSPGGHTYGCLELLNSPNGFRDWHMEAAQAIAGTLADFVSRREGA
jgi:Nif-specific regulatory protein